MPVEAKQSWGIPDGVQIESNRMLAVSFAHNTCTYSSSGTFLSNRHVAAVGLKATVSTPWNSFGAF